MEPEDEGIIPSLGVSPTEFDCFPSFRNLPDAWKCLKSIFGVRSLFNLMWKQILVYYFLHISLTLIYDYGLTSTWQAKVDEFSSYISKFPSGLPLSLLLGFFLNTALPRLLSTVRELPGTNRPIVVFMASLKPDLEDGQQRVNKYARLLVLLWLMSFRMVCVPLYRKYPTLRSIQDAGFLKDGERQALEQFIRLNGITKAPLLITDWLTGLVRDTAAKGCFLQTSDLNRIIDLVQTEKKSMKNVMKTYSKNIPVALTQAVTIVIYLYGFESLMGRQFSEKNPWIAFLNGYFPILNVMPFFLYFVWLKVGKMAANPFGEDYDDIDLVNLFDEQIQNAFREANEYKKREISFSEDVTLNWPTVST